MCALYLKGVFIITKYCKICGTAFECVHGSGAYCSDACRKVGTMISRQRYAIKQRTKTTTKQTITPKQNQSEQQTRSQRYNHEYYENVTKLKRAEQNKATKIVCSTTNIIKPAENNTTDIVIEELEKAIKENLELLDAVRDELQKLTDDLKARQSAYDQKDIENLHLLEGATSDASLLEYAKKCNADRHNRRNYKNYISFLISVLKYIPIKTCDAFEKSKQVQENKNTFYSIKY